MKIAESDIIVTSGASGIGRGLFERFSRLGGAFVITASAAGLAVLESNSCPN
jgi:short-subunit dehydrogenase involved in D-alanine esterification of teichoic acids